MRPIAFLLLLVLNTAVYGQEHPILGSFLANEEEGDVILSWVIEAGSSCNGTRIYRSANNTEFEQVGEIFGICGSIDKPESYTFRDENPVKNAVNYYKLELGVQGFSQVVSVEVIDIESGNQVRPNPANETTRIYFDNDLNTEHSLILYNIEGKLILSDKTNKDYFDLDVRNIDQGIHYFSIFLPGSPFKTTGKLLISH